MTVMLSNAQLWEALIHQASFVEWWQVTSVATDRALLMGHALAHMLAPRVSTYQTFLLACFFPLCAVLLVSG